MLRIGEIKLVIEPTPPTDSSLRRKRDASVRSPLRQETTLCAQRAVRNVELRSVEEIEELSAELQLHTLP